MRTNQHWENVCYMVLLILGVVFVFDSVSNAARRAPPADGCQRGVRGSAGQRYRVRLSFSNSFSTCSSLMYVARSPIDKFSKPQHIFISAVLSAGCRRRSP
jgi:hypothetical protein